MIHLLKSNNDIPLLAISRSYREIVGSRGVGATFQWQLFANRTAHVLDSLKTRSRSRWGRGLR